MTEVKVAVESIRVDGRHRKDLGDIEALARSIQQQGLINAITITPDNYLLAGERRLAAFRLLRRTTIEARVVDTVEDAAARLRIERDENTERKEMAPSEMVALGRAIEALERPKAEARRTSAPMNKRPDQLGRTAESGNTRDIVAAALGTSASTYERAKTVVNAAADPTASEGERQIAQQALADMDSGAATISGAFDRVRKMIQTKAGIQRPVIQSAAAQRRAVGSAEAALSGICHGLGQIADLHPDITSEEAARWVGSLSESRRIIAALITRLKERTNAQP